MIYVPINKFEFQLYEEGNMPSNYEFSEEQINSIISRINVSGLSEVSTIELMALANYGGEN